MPIAGASRCSILKGRGKKTKKKKWKPMESAEVFTSFDIKRMAARDKGRGIIHVCFDDGSHIILPNNKENRVEYELEDE